MLLKSMLVKDPQKRCSWDYLFNVPLTKDGTYINEFKQYEHILYKPIEPAIALQQLDHNMIYNKDHIYATYS